MSVFSKNNPEKIKFFLYSVIILVIIVIVAIFISYRLLSDNTAILNPDREKATLSLDEVAHTATKEGIKQWSLKASTVDYYKEKDKAVFNVLTVVLYSEENNETRLTSDTGTLNTKNNNITASGNVVAVNGEYVLNTETLHYHHKDRIISSSVPVRITENASKITADSMKADLNTNITILEGNVKGTFSGNIKLF